MDTYNISCKKSSKELEKTRRHPKEAVESVNVFSTSDRWNDDLGPK